MRAAHSLKGAARIVGLDVGVRVAHAMEDCFVAAQEGRLTLRQAQIDLLLGATTCWRASPTPPRRTSASGTPRRRPKSMTRLAALAGILAGDAAAPIVGA